jgi:hypothetical protein
MGNVPFLKQPLERLSLFKRTVDRAEPGVEPATNPVHHSNNRERNASRNQTILNCRRARVIGQKSANGFYHSPGLVGADEDQVKMGSGISWYSCLASSKSGPQEQQFTFRRACAASSKTSVQIDHVGIILRQVADVRRHRLM